MIGKGKSISHGVAALEYDLAKEIDGQAAATEIARHELYGCTGAEMVQEMKPYFTDFPNVKNNCLRFEVSPSIEESATFTDADWADLVTTSCSAWGWRTTSTSSSGTAVRRARKSKPMRCMKSLPSSAQSASVKVALSSIEGLTSKRRQLFFTFGKSM